MTTTRPVLPVQLGDHWLCLDALDAREVLGAVRWVPLPGATQALPGVIAWNGRAIAFVDLGAALTLSGPAEAARERTVVCQRRGCHFAFQVDAVREVRHLDAEQVKAAELVRHPFSAGEVELDGRTVSVLDLDGLLRTLLPEAS